jgi:hypothetical protein
MTARLDVVLVGLLLALAFVLASFTARNTDLWMHLGTGKLLLDGQYRFGADPFAHTTQDAYWVNHSWLFDVLAYLVYNSLGGASLVILKAIMLAAIAGVLVRTRRTGRELWLPVVCTALAALAISRWFLVQPIGISYLFLALTVCFLERQHRVDETGASPKSWTEYWPLLVLFVLWVNLDGWFLIGPLTVALYWIGARLSGRQGARGHNLAPVFLLGLALCLVNPHHIRVFVLPAQLGLSEAGSALRQHPLFRGMFLSPLHEQFYRPSVGLNAVGMAYFALIILSLLSFALNRSGWMWHRALLWSAMLLLSLATVVAIPFFAIVAGPIAAINLQEALAHRNTHSSPLMPGLWPIGGRMLSALLGFVLIVDAWPGWLQALPPEPRQWDVKTDASLERTAARLAEWRRTGKLGASDLAFNSSLDTANYLAFFAPSEQGFFDNRLQLFSREAVNDFLAVRLGLAGNADPDSQTRATQKRTAATRTDWRQILRKRHVNHVVLHDSELARSAPLFRRMANSQEWVLLHLDGRTAVFGWLDPANPKAADAFVGMRLDLDRRAFHPREDERAPRQWPGRDPDPHWWGMFLGPPTSRDPATDEATFLLNYFDELKPRYYSHHIKTWTNAQTATYLASTCGGDAPMCTPLGYALRSSLAGIFLLNPLPEDPSENWTPTRMQVNGLQLRNEFLGQHDDGPMGVALMAIRAARRAIHANPDDAHAYLALGEAYLRLSRGTRERMALRRMKFMERIRQVQAIIAFNNALTLNPDLAQAHDRLANYYAELRYVDLVLKHRKEYLRITSAAGPAPGEKREQFEERIVQLEANIAQLDQDVKQLLNVFEVNASNLKIVPRAQQALARGLGGKALEILKGSDITAFGKPGLEMELELLLTTGGIREFRAWFDPEQHRTILNEPSAPFACEWFIVYKAAASGDYDEADENLAAMDPTESFRAQTVPLVTQAFLAVNPQAPTLISLMQASLVWERVRNRETLWSLQQLYRADLTVIRGLLALECGATERATELFHHALAVADAALVTGPGAKVEFSGRPIAESCLELLSR